MNRSRFPLSFWLAALVACAAHRPGSAGGSGCTSYGIGPAGSIAVDSVAVPDSSLTVAGLGALDVQVRWTTPPGPFRTRVYIRLSKDTLVLRQWANSAGKSTLLAQPGAYDLRVDPFGGHPVSAPVTVRRGLRAAVVVELQAEGQACD